MEQFEQGLVSTDRIDVPEEQRLRIDRGVASIDMLMATIPLVGLLQPLVVIRRGERFELVAGACRLAACRQLGWAQVPVRVVPEGQDHRAATVIENLSRTQLTPVEEAAAVAQLTDPDNPDVDKVCAQLGRSRAWVEQRLHVLTWDSQTQEAVHEGNLSMAAAGLLAQIPDPNRRGLLVQQAIANGINRQTAQLWLSQELGATPVAELTTEDGRPAYPVVSGYETRAICFGCGQSVDYKDAQRVNFCPPCVSAMVEMQRQRGDSSPGAAVEAAPAENQGGGLGVPAAL